MKLRIAAIAAATILAACAQEAPPADTAADAAPATEAAAAAPTDAGQLACVPQRDPADRASPYDSVRIDLGGREALVCYGRPSARGRTMIGGDAVPYGRLWRTGANEPTILHLGFPASVAGIDAEPGSYSLYTIPGDTEWTVILNRSIDQWGHESSYTADVEAQEVGRSTVPAGSTAAHVEQFTIGAEPVDDDSANLVLEWENVRILLPLRAR